MPLLVGLFTDLHVYELDEKCTLFNNPKTRGLVPVNNVIVIRGGKRIIKGVIESCGTYVTGGKDLDIAVNGHSNLGSFTHANMSVEDINSTGNLTGLRRSDTIDNLTCTDAVELKTAKSTQKMILLDLRENIVSKKPQTDCNAVQQEGNRNVSHNISKSNNERAYFQIPSKNKEIQNNVLEDTYSQRGSLNDDNFSDGEQIQHFRSKGICKKDHGNWHMDRVMTVPLFKEDIQILNDYEFPEIKSVAALANNYEIVPNETKPYNQNIISSNSTIYKDENNSLNHHCIQYESDDETEFFKLPCYNHKSMAPISSVLRRSDVSTSHLSDIPPIDSADGKASYGTVHATPGGRSIIQTFEPGSPLNRQHPDYDYSMYNKDGLTSSQRISPGPLILGPASKDPKIPFTSHGLQSVHTKQPAVIIEDESKTKPFTLQDPPRKFKRQLSNETTDCTIQTSFIENTCVAPIVSIADKTTPKRLKPSVQDTGHNIPKQVICPTGQHIRTSTVIRTPNIKESDVFIFPETSPTNKQTEQQLDYLLEAINQDSRSLPIYDNEENSSGLVSSPFTPKKSRQDNNLLTGNLMFTDTNHHHKSMYYDGQCSSQRPRLLHSQSNVDDHSPSKYSQQELDKLRYLRSVSMPANESDLLNSLTHYTRYSDHSRKLRQSNDGKSWTPHRARKALTFDKYQQGNEFEELPTSNGRQITSRHLESRGINLLEGTPLQVINEDVPRSTRYNSPHLHTSQCCYKTNTPYNNTEYDTQTVGVLNLRIQCSGIARECQNISQRQENLNASLRYGGNCVCQRIEEDVLQLAMDAYRKIPHNCNSIEEQRQMETEIHQTNYMVLEAIKVATRMKELCDHGRTITRITTGSVIIRLHCPTLTSLEDLWIRYKSGELTTLINYIFITPRLLKKYNAKCIYLKVTVLQSEYIKCQNQFVSGILQSPVTTLKKTTFSNKKSPNRVAKSAENLLNISESPRCFITKTRCSSTPTLLHYASLCSPTSPSKRELKFAFSSNGDQSPRRVFQDLNSPRSPNRRFNFDGIRHIVESPHFSKNEVEEDNLSVGIYLRRLNSTSHSTITSQLSPNYSPTKYSPR